MVLRLAAALDVPLRQQNELLLDAGFAPAWRESDLAAPELATVKQALDHMLAQQEPFPAIVDVTVQELRIECFFPADGATSQVFKDWAAHSSHEPGIAS
jgi:hypothetical protein